ncbi:MAG TPA: FAD-dependent oxidoreductase [Gaiellaceae bacterium]|nr:FAD-dependent oxidoreductase [Gaiellaceae bacterium]
MSAPDRVLIVGAGLAGARCAETLRAGGFEGELGLVGAEPVPPYERPALSKEHLAGDRDARSLALRPPGFWEENGIELRLGRRVTAVDVAARVVHTEAGDELGWDALVLATGASPRLLPDWAGPGVHTLRTLADAESLRGELGSGARVAIVGAGFVGTEVASTAASLGVPVTLVDVTATPLERVLGAEIGAALAGRYAEAGVELCFGSGVERLERGPTGRPKALVLSNGASVPADAVVLAIGVRPEVDGIPVAGENGIPTDACGRTGVPDVFAAGDVSEAWHPLLGRSLRVEHWTSAAGQGAAVAHAILGEEMPHTALPYFWSDQFGLRLQYVGHAETWAAVEIEGEPGSLVARYLDGAGTTVAALAVNRPAEVGRLRTELTAALAETSRLAA